MKDASDFEDISNLFRELDVDNDGALSISELEKACSRMGMSTCTMALSEFRKAWKGKSALTLSEFEQVVESYESVARLEFKRQKQLARFRSENSRTGLNHDMYFDRDDVRDMFRNKFVNDEKELEKFVDLVFERVDMNRDDKISFAEFVLWAVMKRSTDLETLYDDYRSDLDIGEDVTPPSRGKRANHNLGFLAAGAFAGVISRTATAPLERLKLLLQTSSQRDVPLMSRITNILSKEGVRSFWRGNLANCLKVAPAKALKFASYEQVKNVVCKNPKRATVVENFFAAGSVSLVTGIGVFPLDTLKTRLSVMSTKQTVSQAALDLYKIHGVRGFFFGVVPSMMSSVPFSGMNMAVFMKGKQVYKDRYMYNELQPLPAHACVIMSVVSTLSAQLVAYPLYCIKANLQAGEGNRNLIGEIRRVVSQKGFLGLYSGLSMNFIKALPAVAVTFTVYEQAKSMMGL